MGSKTIFLYFTKFISSWSMWISWTMTIIKQTTAFCSFELEFSAPLSVIRYILKTRTWKTSWRSGFGEKVLKHVRFWIEKLQKASVFVYEFHYASEFWIKFFSFRQVFSWEFSNAPNFGLNHFWKNQIPKKTVHSKQYVFTLFTQWKGKILPSLYVLKMHDTESKFFFEKSDFQINYCRFVRFWTFFCFVRFWVQKFSSWQISK